MEKVNHIKALYQFRAAGMMGIIVLSSVACSDVSLEQVSLPVIEKTFNIHISSYCPIQEILLLKHLHTIYQHQWVTIVIRPIPMQMG